MNTADRDLEEARRIVLNGLQGIPAKVYLFGSWARGEARRYSDIDIALDAAAPLPASVLLDIEEALDQSEVLHRVDLVDLATASQSLRDRVSAEGIPWNG